MVDWTGDTALFDELWPAAEAALGWCEKYGDRDGDGDIEYPGGALETKAGRTRTIPSATSTGRPPKRLRIAPVETPLWRRLEVTGLHFAGHRIDFSVDGTRVKLGKLPPGIIVDTHRR